MPIKVQLGLALKKTEKSPNIKPRIYFHIGQKLDSESSLSSSTVAQTVITGVKAWAKFTEAVSRRFFGPGQMSNIPAFRL